jgi:hypothetical protein
MGDCGIYPGCSGNGNSFITYCFRPQESEEPGMEWLKPWLQAKVEAVKVRHIPSHNPFMEAYAMSHNSYTTRMWIVAGTLKIDENPPKQIQGRSVKPSSNRSMCGRHPEFEIHVEFPSCASQYG